MSEATRVVALQAAIALAAKGAEAETVLTTAAEFEAFLSLSGDTPAKGAQKAAAPTKAATKPATKPVPAKKPTKPPVDDDAEPEAEETTEEGEGEEGLTREEVGASVAKLLNNDMRDQAIALFKKYKAESLGSLKSEHFAAFKQDADDALMAG